MKKLLCLGMVCLLLCSTGMLAAEEAVSPMEELAGLGILSGDEAGDLHAEAPISRAELAKMLVLACQEKPEGVAAFSDVPRSHWASSYIAAAASLGIVNGFEDGTFHPDDAVTYEDAVKMVLAAFGVKLDYPFGYLSHAMDNGYLDGIPAVMGRYATRGDVAALLVNVLHQQEKPAEPAETMPTGGDSGASIGGVSGGGSSMSGGSGGGLSMSSTAGISAPQADGMYEVPPLIPSHNTEEYDREAENRFHEVAQSPVSTFSIDVDTASYSNMRRFLTQGSLPQLGAVRTEELINYFTYTVPQPEEGQPLAVTAEVNDCPWNPAHQLAMITMRGEELDVRAPQNLVFLIDVSGSMFQQNKLPLVQKAMGMLVESLTEADTVSIVTYAGSTAVRLAGSPGNDKDRILSVINNLQAGGSTAGGAGIQLAYDTALAHKVAGNNRVILCTDGDFNVGISSTAELEALITDRRDDGIYLSVLGFGTGNYKDNRMETLADTGNGNYAYIDNVREAKKVLVDDMTQTLYTVANDVKLQVEFNPQRVAQYRLVGYENRMLQTEDFADDTKDAGELGAGQSVTAFYELIPAAAETAGTSLRYQTTTEIPSDELFCVNVRYKLPGEDTSALLTYPVTTDETQAPSEDFRFASAVAAFGMALNESEYLNGWTYADILTQAEGAIGEDPFHLRTEFVQLVGIARYLEREPIGTIAVPAIPW